MPMSEKELQSKIIDVLNTIYPEYHKVLPNFPDITIKLYYYIKENFHVLVKMTGKTKYIHSKLLNKLKDELSDAQIVYLKLLNPKMISLEYFLDYTVDVFLVFLRLVFKDKYDPERLLHLVHEKKYLLPALIVTALVLEEL
ncbi:MAG: hypothetical protein ACTSSP_08255 [Candidatus Asgardarchaeia archaeon]